MRADSKFAGTSACVLLAVGRLLNAQTSNPANEIPIGPVPVAAAYAGVDLTMLVRAFVNVASSPSGLDVAIRLQGDLGNVQNRIGQVVDSIPLPKDNCASFGLNNPVVKIWGKQLQATGNSAVLTLHGSVEVWGCASNPIPNSKFEWRNDGPFHLSIPHFVTWPGDPIKTIIATQPFDVSLPVTLRVIDDHTVSITPGQPNITLGGQFVGITNAVLKIAGVDINAKAAEALSQAIDPNKLKQVLPPEMLKLKLKISSAQFINNGGSLAVQVTMSSHLPPDELNGLIMSVVAKRTS